MSHDDGTIASILLRSMRKTLLQFETKADDKLRAFVASKVVHIEKKSNDDGTVVDVIVYRMTDEHLIVLKPNNPLQRHRT